MSENNSIPTFTPPSDKAPTFAPPTFTPPTGHRHNHYGASCHYHHDEPAVATCARCDKNLCDDCYDAYGVEIGEYANQALCYDCTRQLVAENVQILKKNKVKIIVTFVFTLIGMLLGLLIGFGIGNDSGSPGMGMIFGAAIGGCAWTFFKNWMKRLWGGFSGGNFSLVGFVIGLTLGFVIEAFVSIYRTIRKIIECIVYLKRTSGAIVSDSQALVQMEEYMEYTRIRSQNKGVDLETLMSQGSELYNNSFAQMVRERGEEAATEEIARATTRIAANGEIIRDFAA